VSLAWSEVQHGIALEYHTVKGGGGECGGGGGGTHRGTL